MQNRPIDITPHLFERSAPQLAKLVGFAEAGPMHPAPAPGPAANAALHAADRDASVAFPAPPAQGPKPPAIEAAALRRAGIIELAQGRSRAFEEFRIVQDQVVRLLTAGADSRGPLGRTVLVTSATPGEGKSFVAANLAAAFARCGNRDTLLVDIDPKPASLSRVLGLAQARGLLDAAIEGPAAEIAVLPTAIERLSVLPVGGSSADRSVMSATGLVPEMLRRLPRAFPGQVIVLDAPPCLASSDASMLASLVDQVVMVIAASETQQNDLEAALDLVQACPNIALLLNKVRSNSGSGFGSYGDYR